VIVKRSLVGDPPGWSEGVGVAGSRAPSVAGPAGNPWVGGMRLAQRRDLFFVNEEMEGRKGGDNLGDRGEGGDT